MDNTDTPLKAVRISPEILRLAEPKISVFLGYLAMDWIGVIAGFALFHAYPTVAGFLAASVILGFSQHGLIVLGHEAVHFRICKSRFFNEWIGRLFCFFPITLTVSSYRDFHFPHHRDPFGENDPEIPLRIALGKNFAPPFKVSRGLRLWALSFLGFSVKELAVFVSMMPRGSVKEKIYLVGYWTMLLAVTYHFHAWAYLGAWAVGLFTTYFSKLRIQGWYEHGLSEMTTSRYSLPNLFYRFIMPHNIWVHYEHHKYPSIPFYNLEKVRLLDHSDKIYGLDEMVQALTELNLKEGKKETATAA
jgi:fatty acid desaturase